MLCKYNNKSRRKTWLVGLQNTNASLEVIHVYTNEKVLDKSKKIQLNRFQMAKLERLDRDEKALG